MLTKSIFTFFLSLYVASPAFAHGENIPGPNNGFILMPGAFHSEVVPQENGLIRLHLLDISFKKLQFENVNVEATINRGNVKLNGECKSVAGYFECQFEPQTLFDAGTLQIKIRIDENPEGIAVYPLPLKR